MFDEIKQDRSFFGAGAAWRLPRGSGLTAARAGAPGCCRRSCPAGRALRAAPPAGSQTEQWPARWHRRCRRRRAAPAPAAGRRQRRVCVRTECHAARCHVVVVPRDPDQSTISSCWTLLGGSASDAPTPQALLPKLLHAFRSCAAPADSKPRCTVVLAATRHCSGQGGEKRGGAHLRLALQQGDGLGMQVVALKESQHILCGSTGTGCGPPGRSARGWAADAAAPQRLGLRHQQPSGS